MGCVRHERRVELREPLHEREPRHDADGDVPQPGPPRQPHPEPVPPRLQRGQPLPEAEAEDEQTDEALGQVDDEAVEGLGPGRENRVVDAEKAGSPGDHAGADEPEGADPEEHELGGPARRPRPKNKHTTTTTTTTQMRGGASSRETGRRETAWRARPREGRGPGPLLSCCCCAGPRRTWTAVWIVQGTDSSDFSRHLRTQAGQRDEPPPLSGEERRGEGRGPIRKVQPREEKVESGGGGEGTGAADKTAPTRNRDRST